MGLIDVTVRRNDRPTATSYKIHSLYATAALPSREIPKGSIDDPVRQQDMLLSILHTFTHTCILTSSIRTSQYTYYVYFFMYTEIYKSRRRHHGVVDLQHAIFRDRTLDFTIFCPLSSLPSLPINLTIFSTRIYIFQELIWINSKYQHFH